MGETAEPPGVQDPEAARILEDAVTSPDHCLELDSARRSQLKRDQEDFYHNLARHEEKDLSGSIGGALSRISISIPFALTNALGIGPIVGSDSSSASRAWRSFDQNLGSELIDFHLRPLHDISIYVYKKYHRYTKPQLVEVGADFREKAMEDFLKLGEEFQKLFNSKGLFLSLEEFQTLGVIPEAPHFPDGSISIKERIERFELYRDELKLDVGLLKSEIIFPIEEAYWQRGDEERGDYETSLGLLRHMITRAEDQNIGGDLVDGLEKLGNRYMTIGKVSEAEETFSRALTEGRKFGNDNRVAYLLTKLVESRISNQDSDLSAAYGELAEAEEIWLRYGHKKALLRTISAKVKLHIAQEEYEEAEAEINKGVNLYDEDFYPRGRWRFFDRCSRYLLGCPDEEMNSKGLELLEQAIALAKKYGEFDNLLSSLETKRLHAEDIDRLEARSEFDHYSNLKKDLDRVIDQFAQTNQDGTEAIEEFVSKLVGANYRQGLRRASNLIPIEQVAGMGPEYFDWFEGEYGRYRSLKRQIKALAKDIYEAENNSALKHALELLDESEKLATKFDSPYFLTSILEIRFRVQHSDLGGGKVGRGAVAKSKISLLIKQRSLILELIDKWTFLDSHVGSKRWKQALARTYWRISKLTKKKIDPRTIELMEEIADFYKDKDAKRYAYARFDLIKWRHPDESVDSTSEYVALIRDPALPSDPGIMLELYRRTANYLYREGRLGASIEILSKANDIVMETHSADTNTSFSDLKNLQFEINWHIENGDDARAEDRLKDFNRFGGRDWGGYTAGEALISRSRIENMRGNHKDAKELLRKRISKPFNRSTRSKGLRRLYERSVSNSFFRLWEIHIKLDEPIEAEEVLTEKIYFDASVEFYGFVVVGIADQTKAIRERSGAKAAKEFLIRLCDDDRIPLRYSSSSLVDLHIELKEWAEAEVLLKEHMIPKLEPEDSRRLNSFITRLIHCCQENKGPDHAIEVLRGLADDSDYQITSASHHALINFHREREEFPEAKELLRSKIEFEMENENLVLSLYDSRTLAELHIELGELEDAKRVIREVLALKSSSYYIHRILLSRLYGIHKDLGELEDAKRVIREVLDFGHSPPKSRSHDLRRLLEIHQKLEEWGDAEEILEERMQLNSESGDSTGAFFDSEELFKIRIRLKRWEEAREAMQGKIRFTQPEKRARGVNFEVKSAISNFKSLTTEQLDSQIYDDMKEASIHLSDVVMFTVVEEKRRLRDELKTEADELTGRMKELRDLKEQLDNKRGGYGQPLDSEDKEKRDMIVNQMNEVRELTADKRAKLNRIHAEWKNHGHAFREYTSLSNRIEAAERIIMGALI